MDHKHFPNTKTNVTVSFFIVNFCAPSEAQEVTMF